MRKLELAPPLFGCSKISTSDLKPIIFAVSILAIVVLTWWSYAPGLKGPFIHDDTRILPGIVSKMAMPESITDAVNLRQIALWSFSLDDPGWPSDSGSFKETNLKIHILCGLLLSWLAIALSRALNLSQSHQLGMTVAAASIWLLHPLLVTTTLYVVQRMTQLATLFCLTGAIIYVYARARGPRLRLWEMCLAVCGIFACLLLAAMSKQIGALLPIFLISIELTALRKLSRYELQRPLIFFCIALPIIGLIGSLMLTAPGFMHEYKNYHFNMQERLLTEARVLFSYLREILLPSSLGKTVYHDGYVISRGLFQPTTTVFSIAGLLGLLFAGILARKNQPFMSLAIFWFFGGHILESTFIPLHLYYEHRNYLPLAGIALCIGHYLALMISNTKPLYLRAACIFALCVLINLETRATRELASIWSSEEHIILHSAEYHPASYWTNRQMILLAIREGHYNLATRIAEEWIKEHDPNNGAMQIVLLNISCYLENLSKSDLSRTEQALSKAWYDHNSMRVLAALVEDFSSNKCKTFDIEIMGNIFRAIESSPDSNIDGAQGGFFYTTWAMVLHRAGEHDDASNKMLLAHREDKNLNRVLAYAAETAQSGHIEISEKIFTRLAKEVEDGILTDQGDIARVKGLGEFLKLIRKSQTE